MQNAEEGQVGKKLIKFIEIQLILMENAELNLIKFDESHEIC